MLTATLAHPVGLLITFKTLIAALLAQAEASDARLALEGSTLDTTQPEPSNNQIDHVDGKDNTPRSNAQITAPNQMQQLTSSGWRP
ncbi:hypothetical protein ABVK25_007747 [Lepraria finkii]|uniref:Secreted protein n=1 Tax=Lepraria finkii TaxID=1340010 RepID=A0ABR4B2D3_9LECA